MLVSATFFNFILIGSCSIAFGDNSFEPLFWFTGLKIVFDACLDYLEFVELIECEENGYKFSIFRREISINEIKCKVPKFNLRMQQYLIWMRIYDSYAPTSVIKAVSLIHGSYAQ